MDRVSIDLDFGLGQAARAFAVCGLLGLIVICVTCLVVIVIRPDAPEVMRALAEIIKAFRKQPKIVLSRDPPDVIPKLPRAS